MTSRASSISPLQNNARAKGLIDPLLYHPMNSVHNPITNAIVDQTLEWLPIETCPHGAVVWLLTVGNMSVKSQYRRGDTDVKGWFPMPNIPDHMK